MPDMRKNEDITYYSTAEITQTTLNLALTSLEDEDFDSTKNLIEFASKILFKESRKNEKC